MEKEKMKYKAIIEITEGNPCGLISASAKDYSSKYLFPFITAKISDSELKELCDSCGKISTHKSKRILIFGPGIIGVNRKSKGDNIGLARILDDILDKSESRALFGLNKAEFIDHWLKCEAKNSHFPNEDQYMKAAIPEDLVRFKRDVLQWKEGIEFKYYISKKQKEWPGAVDILEFNIANKLGYKLSIK